MNVNGTAERVKRPAMTGMAPLAACRFELASVASSVYWARRQTEEALRVWDLTHVTDTVLLVVSELVTNAIKHPEVPDSLTAHFGPTRVYRIAVTLVALPGSLMIEVYDPDPTPPVVRRQSLDAEGGRGLFLVKSLCQQINCCQLRTGGKVVRAHLAIPPDLESDEAILRRVRDALLRQLEDA